MCNENLEWYREFQQDTSLMNADEARSKIEENRGGEVTEFLYQLMYYASGLSKEAGELLELAHKEYFAGADYPTKDYLSELGDVLWNFVGLLDLLGLDLDDVMEANYRKLQSRRCKDAGNLWNKGYSE